MLTQLVIEPERDEDGYHAVVVDIGEDCILHVTDSYSGAGEAVRAAQTWIQQNA